MENLKRKGEKHMKLKKVLAVLMASAMIMGMSVTTFAATETTITINNAGSGEFAAVQIVEPDSTADTGWRIVSDYESYFASAFGLSNTPDNMQTIIKGMIYFVDNNAKEGVALKNFEKNYQSALESIYTTIDMTNATDAQDGTAVITVTDDTNVAGVWAVRGEEEGFNYNPMASYIDFVSGRSENINAKKAPTSTDKSADDKVVEIGENVTYTLESIVPFVPASDDNRTYKVVDTITNGEYVTNSNGNVDLTVTLTSPDPEVDSVTKTYEGIISTDGLSNNQQKFEADLSDLLGDPDQSIEDNQYANWSISIEYSATVNSINVHNDVKMGGHDGQWASGSEDVYTGKLVLTKKNEEGVYQEALFAVQLKDGTPENENKYATFTQDSDGNYVFTGTWVDDYKATGEGDSNNDGFLDSAVVMTDASDGQAVVKGFDDEYTYTFVEIKAPDGYSIADPEDAVWNTESSNSDKTGTATVINTQLASLPSTGGIGTTIFTIGGCVIMVSAAGLYFASRRRQENK